MSSRAAKLQVELDGYTREKQRLEGLQERLERVAKNREEKKKKEQEKDGEKEEKEKKEEKQQKKDDGEKKEEKKDNPPSSEEEEENSDGEVVKKKKSKSTKKDEGDGEKKNGEEDDEKPRRKRERDEDEEREKASKDQPETVVKRNRQMFGRLLGHLGAARKDLGKERNTRLMEARAKAEQSVNSKLQKKEDDLDQLEGKALEDRQESVSARLKELGQKVTEGEAALVRARLEEHYGMMQNFIRTKSEPTIFYLPAKHNPKTEELLEETKDAIKQKIASMKDIEPPRNEEKKEDKEKKKKTKKDDSDSDSESSKHRKPEANGKAKEDEGPSAKKQKKQKKGSGSESESSPPRGKKED